VVAVPETPMARAQAVVAVAMAEAEAVVQMVLGVAVEVAALITLLVLIPGQQLILQLVMLQ
jgi:hypothetical protein